MWEKKRINIWNFILNIKLVMRIILFFFFCYYDTAKLWYKCILTCILWYLCNFRTRQTRCVLCKDINVPVWLFFKFIFYAYLLLLLLLWVLIPFNGMFVIDRLKLTLMYCILIHTFAEISRCFRYFNKIWRPLWAYPF